MKAHTLMFGAALLLAVLLTCKPVPVNAHDGHITHVQGIDNDAALRAWISSLKDRRGVGCCSTADGFPVGKDDVEWDTGTDDSRDYRVRIEGVWHKIPPVALLDNEPNKVGYAIVWWYRQTGETGVPNGSVVIRCFIPGDVY